MLTKLVKDDTLVVKVFLHHLQEDNYVIKVDEAVC